MQTLTQSIKELANELEIAPEGIEVHCNPVRDRDGEVVQEVQLIYDGDLYDTLRYYDMVDIVREFKAVNDEFPDLEIHV